MRPPDPADARVARLVERRLGDVAVRGHDVSEERSTEDGRRRLLDCARAALEAFGDSAFATKVVTPDVLELVVACHIDPQRQLVARYLLGEQFRFGQGLNGRVWQSQRGILIVDVDPAALSNMSPPSIQRYVREVGIQSLMIAPLRQGDQVVGTLCVTRDRDRPRYSEEEFQRFQAMAFLEAQDDSNSK